MGIAMALVGACMFLVGMAITLVVMENIKHNAVQEVYEMYLEEMYRRVRAESELENIQKSKDTFAKNKVKYLGRDTVDRSDI